jgi:hypothetical protein
VSSLHQWSDPDHSAGLQFEVIPTAKLSDKLTLLVDYIFSKDLTQERKLKSEQGVIQLGHSAIPLNPYLRLSPSVASLLPVNQSLYEDQSFRGSLGATVGLLGDLDRAGMGWLRPGYSVGIRRNFHEFEVAKSGSSNFQYQLTQQVMLIVDIVENLTFTTKYFYRYRWTYKSNRSDIFNYDAALDYDLGQGLTASLGLNNTGNGLAADGQSSNIALIDGQQSTVSLGLSVSL